MPESIRVMLVDDHALVRGALSERISREPDLTVVGTAGTADEALELAPAVAPDIVLMDIDMPGRTCFDAAQALRAARPRLRVIFLSAFLHDWYIEQAVAVKAGGYLTKSETPEVVIAALRAVAAGGTYYSEPVRARLLAPALAEDAAAAGHARATMLTVREIEVLRYLARGLSKKQIATTMHLSVKTVDRHTANLMNKLDIHDRVELARYAIREGIAEP